MQRQQLQLTTAGTRNGWDWRGEVPAPRVRIALDHIAVIEHLELARSGAGGTRAALTESRGRRGMKRRVTSGPQRLSRVLHS